MKPLILASLLLAAFNSMPASLACDDSDQAASEVSGAIALSAVSTPVLVTAAGLYLGAGLTVGTAHQLVKLVDKNGNGLSELTQDGLDLLFSDDYPTKPATLNDGLKPPITVVNQKQIPLVVRQDYVELNQKVDLGEKSNMLRSGHA